jgi:dihydroneopterin aldolase
VGSFRIVLTGIRAHGRHGAEADELAQPQEFIIDLDVTVDVGEDSLTETVDYRILTDTAREIVASTSFHLLESVAEAVAKAAYQYSGVVRVTAVVHKPSAAASIGVEDVSAEATIA